MKLKYAGFLMGAIALIASSDSVKASPIITYNTSLAAPGLIFGAGNLNQNFTTSTDGSTELGLSVILSNTGPIDPGAFSNTYIVPAGAVGGQSKWGFDFAINTRYNGGTNVLGMYNFALMITDVTTGNAGPLIPVVLIPDDTGYGPPKTVGVNPVTQYLAQNSERPSFTGFLPGFDANAQDLYKISFTQTTLAGGVVQTFDVLADATGVARTPEPGTLLMFGGALILGAVKLIRTKQRT